MKNISPALQALFDTRQFHYASLYQFDLVTGGTLRYTGADCDVLWASQTYSAGGTTGPFLETAGRRAKMRQKIGLEVDTLAFDVIPGEATVQGQPFLVACRQGAFDGATLTYMGAYWAQGEYASPIVPVGVVTKFSGRVAEVDFSRSLASFIVNSHLELLNQNMPRNVWQAGCANTLYDTSCTLIKSNFESTDSILSGSTPSQINCNLTEATGYFDLGILTFNTGANAGISRTVKAYVQDTVSTVSLISPFPNTPQVGDTFSIYPGCDKAQATCFTKFNNLANFRGFPFVPEQATAV